MRSPKPVPSLFPGDSEQLAKDKVQGEVGKVTLVERRRKSIDKSGKASIIKPVVPRSQGGIVCKIKKNGPPPNWSCMGALRTSRGALSSVNSWEQEMISPLRSARPQVAPTDG
jgi:hypothetical protein